MGKTIALLIAALLTTHIVAQSPEKMSYQAVIRNSSDQLVINTQIGMEINILKGSESGMVVYTESQTPKTNSNGLVSIEIGGVTGFGNINWSNDSYFIETKIAVVAPLTTYTITGISQLLSVPYALSAKTAESITGTIAETDPVYESSQATNITALDISNLSNLSGINTGDQDLGMLATYEAVRDSVEQVRSLIPDISGLISAETDPFYTSSQATNITVNDITHLSNLSGVNSGDQNLSMLATKTGLSDSITKVRSEIPDVSGFINIETDPVFEISQAATINGTVPGQMLYWNGTNWVTVAPGLNGQILSYKNGVPAWTDRNISDLSIGEAYQGGIIAYFLVPGDPGYDPGVKHGLIAAPANLPDAIWGDGIIPGADATALGTGMQNTIDIVTHCFTAGIAARLCNDLVLGGYSDWFLPSKDELNKLYLNQAAVGGFNVNTLHDYWSSTEYANSNSAWGQYFGNSNQYGNDKHTTYIHIRAIRYF